MAGFDLVATFTLEADDDLSTKQYHLVRQSAANKCNQASLSTNSALLGVLQNKPKSGEFATVCYLGLSKIVAGGSIAAGTIITTNSSGRAVAVASGQMAAGRALTSAGSDGEIITALIFPPLRWVGAP